MPILSNENQIPKRRRVWYQTCSATAMTKEKLAKKSRIYIEINMNYIPFLHTKTAIKYAQDTTSFICYCFKGQSLCIASYILYVLAKWLGFISLLFASSSYSYMLKRTHSIVECTTNGTDSFDIPDAQRWNEIFIKKIGFNLRNKIVIIHSYASEMVFFIFFLLHLCWQVIPSISYWIATASSEHRVRLEHIIIQYYD